MSYKLNPDVLLTPDLKEKILKFSDEYTAITNKELHVTSGFRSTSKQAAAMYINYRDNNEVKYAQKDLEAQIAEGYKKGVEQKKSEKEIVAMLKEILDAQVENKRYLSAHMKENAIDVKKDSDLKAIEEIGKKHNYFVYEEKICIHISFT